MKLKTLAPRIKPLDLRRAPPKAKAADPHYHTPEHRAWRAEVLRRAGYCCQHPSCVETIYTATLYADHIVELQDGGDQLDPENGQALCGSHHTGKTMAERTKRMG